jgi:hypothetical protein
MPLMPEEGWKFERAHGRHIELATSREYITVTTALKESGCSDFKHPDRALHAIWRGTTVHDTLERLLKEPVTPDRIKDEMAKISAEMDGSGYLAGFLKFTRDISFELLRDDQGGLLSERKVYHPDYGFAGKFDAAALVNGVPSIVDFKTGYSYRWHSAQTAAYCLGLWGTLEGFKRYTLILKCEGNYKLKLHEEDEEDLGVFLAAVTIAKWKRKNT